MLKLKDIDGEPCVVMTIEEFKKIVLPYIYIGDKLKEQIENHRIWQEQELLKIDAEMKMKKDQAKMIQKSWLDKLTQWKVK